MVVKVMVDSHSVVFTMYGVKVVVKGVGIGAFTKEEQALLTTSAEPNWARGEGTGFPQLVTNTVVVVTCSLPRIR